MRNPLQRQQASRQSGAGSVWAILLAAAIACSAALPATTAYAEDVQPADEMQVSATDEDDRATTTDGASNTTTPVEGDNDAQDEAASANDADAQDAGQTDEADSQEQDAADQPEAEPTPQELLDKLASEHAGDVADGSYVINSLLDANLSLDVYKGQTTNGTSIILWNTKAAAANQRWAIESVGGGYVVIRSSLSGKVLDIPRGVAYAGAGVVQWSRGAGDARNQRWIIVRQADGSFKIVSAQPGPKGEKLVLDVKGGKGGAGASLCIFTEHARQAANQSWSFAKPWHCQVDDLALASKDDLADGTYYIESRLGSDLVLNVKKASAKAGAEVVVWPKTPAAHETWLVTHDAQGFATITNALSGLVLDVSGGKAKNGAKTIQWSQKATGARNQKWVIVQEADGSYTISSALQERHLVLDVAGGKAKAGASLIIWNHQKGAVNQRFVFEEAAIEFARALQVRNGAYAIETYTAPGQVLDVKGGKLTAGQSVAPWNEKLTNNANQVWQLSHDTKGFVHLKIGDGSVELGLKNGVAVLCKESHPWIFETVDEGQFVLRDITTETCLSASGRAVDYTGELNEAPSDLLWRLRSSRVVTGSTSLSAYRAYKLTYDVAADKTYCIDTKTGNRCYGYHRIGKTDLHFDEFTGAMQSNGLQLLAHTAAAYADAQLPKRVTLADGPQRVRIVGDSISTGWGVANTNSLTTGPAYARINGTAWHEPSAKVPTWANELRSYVEDAGGTLVNVSAPGKGYSWFASNLNALLPQNEQFDLTIVFLGTNDRSSDAARLRSDAAAVLDRAIATSGDVVVILPPPVNQTVGITSVNRTLTNVCASRNIQTVNMGSLFYPLGTLCGFTRSAMLTDSLHPSLYGQAIIWGAVGTKLDIL